MTVLIRVVSCSGWMALGLLFCSGPGCRFELWGYQTGFVMLLAAAVLGVATIFLTLQPAVRKAVAAPRSPVRLSCLAAIVAVVIPCGQLLSGFSLPAIHDISTDTLDPPQFVVVHSLRVGADNPLQYSGSETAELQQQAYPDIETLYFRDNYDAVFAAAKRVVARLGWKLTAADREAGHLEATDTSFWFGFTDDVVIRIRPQGGSVKVDLRSKSRVGKSDFGANAARIREFIDMMRSAL